MRKMIKAKIKEAPNDTPIPTPISRFFFDDGGCWGKDVATVGGGYVEVVGAGVLVDVAMSADADTLDERGKFPVGVEAVELLNNLADCDGEPVLTVLDSRRPGPATMPFWLRSNALSQQPAAAAWLPGTSLQQKLCVNEPLTREHGIRLLKTFIATAELLVTAHDVPGDHV